MKRRALFNLKKKTRRARAEEKGIKIKFNKNKTTKEHL